MITIPGYEVFEKRYESDRSLIYRAQRNSDQASVLVKILRQTYPSPKAIARFQMEYDILCSLNLEGVIKAYGLEFYQQSPVIVLEEFDGECLNVWLNRRTFDLAEFLTLAMQVTATLGEIHQHNVTHKDINPSNLVLNPVTRQVKVIDFGLATVLSQENPTLRSPNVLAGTLTYMSPEQTGRMNRAIDYRTDFYSVGVTFYQLLCDRLPFTATDALELVYCHIARQPAPPHEVNPAIPRPVSDVVMKLLAKTAEDRYQSAQGIWADLQECLNQFQQTQTIESFPVGRWDISGKFQIPQKLYGREREVADLLAAFQRVSSHGSSDLAPLEHNARQMTQDKKRSELILVTGASGIGKTTLVQELYKSITRQRGYFITGKYEQLQRNVPYSALIQAFQELVQHLLTETDEQVNDWRSRLLNALGNNGQVIIDVIPDIELVIGTQPDVIELPPIEAQNRFYFTFEKFIQVFTQSIYATDSTYTTDTAHRHPLIIFLDDLQWADHSSLQLIQQLMMVLNDQHLGTSKNPISGVSN